MSPHPSRTSLSRLQTLTHRYYPRLKFAPCTPLRIAGSVPVILVLALIFLAYITAVPATLLRLVHLHPLPVYPLLLVFHFIFLNTLANYLLLVLVDPGSPPADWAAPLPTSPEETRPDVWRSGGALAQARALAERERRSGGRSGGGRGELEAEQLVRGEGGEEVGEKTNFPYAADMRERGYDGGLRYCRVCEAYKPDRAHHCSVCRRCILRMDHHCVFVNNCVSFYNYKFFILFVAYAFLGCLMVVVVSLPTFLALIAVAPRRVVIGEGGGEEVGSGGVRMGVIMGALGSTRRRGAEEVLMLVRAVVGGQGGAAWMRGWANTATMSPTLRMLAVVGYITSAAFALALAVFVGLHFYLVAKGRTTIEMYELTDPTRAARVAEYDLGAAKNFRSVFGSVVACWFLPTRAYVDGDGLKYERRERSEPELSQV